VFGRIIIFIIGLILLLALMALGGAVGPWELLAFVLVAAVAAFLIFRGTLHRTS